jgi:pimeloyl-ACP methyl ester carboxylesterase
VKPGLIYLPGLHGTAGLFKPLLKLLPGKVFELPKEGPQDYATLGAWLSRQSFPPSYLLIAESFGGPLALAHASRRPKGLKGLALLGSFANMGMPLAKILAGFMPPLPLSSRFFRRFSQNALYSGEAGEAELDFFQRETSGTSPWIYRARMQSVMRGDVRPLLPKIKVPVLSVRASRDRMVPGRAEEGLQGIPRLSQVVLDAPHVIAQTRPGPLALALKAFMRGLEKKP